VLQVVIAITGFGKFKGVGENPTERFVKAMPFFLKANPLPPHVVVDRCIVMEVSAEGCKEELDIMRSTVFQNSTDCRVYLHLGVAVGNTTFKLETTAWNGANTCGESLNLRRCSSLNVCRDACSLTWCGTLEASFRVADERGWEPSHEAIYQQDGKPSFRRRTKLPIGKIVRKVQNQHYPVALSSVGHDCENRRAL
jgi:pyrrolidone-carboxylate peptidase